MPQLKAILFDLDDTLIDWSDFSLLWEEAETRHLRGVFDYVQATAPAAGSRLRDFGEFKNEYLKRTRDAWSSARTSLRAPHLVRILSETLEALGIPPDSRDMDEVIRRYGWDAVPGVKVFPDVPAALERLAAQGIRFGIITNAYQPMVMRDTEMATYGLLRYFPSCRFSAADIGYLKPHPVVFETALACLGTTPEETIFIGDNPVADIAGAQSAGMHTILRVKQPAKLLLSGLIIPDGAVNTFDELPAVLEQLYPGWQQQTQAV